MSLLDQKKILLGVSGGIAAYKAPELVRRLRDAGADVRVVLTDAGARFVSALSLEVVSGHAVGQHLWRTDGESRIVHTDLGKDADLIILAPATANLVARVRQGFADDLLTTSVMACDTPVLVCPSMNTDMWANPLVQENVAALDAYERYTFLAPSEGELACGVVGPGRLPDAPVIVEAAASVLAAKTLSGLKAVVTAGPTHEALDPVRFLSNRSTGTMGFALARSLAAAGAQVSLVAGPTACVTPVGLARRVDVTTAAQMADAVQALWGESHALVMAAAVADYRPEAPANQKIKKQAGGLSLALSRTQDILGWTREQPDRTSKFVVGFAAETEDVLARARAKREAKGLDAIVANDVSRADAGFGAGDNEGWLVGADGEAVALGHAPKDAFARAIVAALTPSLTDHLPARAS